MLDYLSHSGFLLAFFLDLLMTFFIFKELNTAIMNFFWTCSIHHQKTIQVASDSCCRPKEEGDFDVRDLRVLNKVC